MVYLILESGVCTIGAICPVGLLRITCTISTSRLISLIRLL